MTTEPSDRPMSPKVAAFLRTQMLLRRQAERQRLAALGREPSVDTEPFDFYAHRRGLERIAELERQLDSIPRDPGGDGGDGPCV